MQSAASDIISQASAMVAYVNQPSEGPNRWPKLLPARKNTIAPITSPAAPITSCHPRAAEWAGPTGGALSLKELYPTQLTYRSSALYRRASAVGK